MKPGTVVFSLTASQAEGLLAVRSGRRPESEATEKGLLGRGLVRLTALGGVELTPLGRVAAHLVLELRAGRLPHEQLGSFPAASCAASS